VRIRFALIIAGTALFAVPALAGTVTINGGQVTWKSTQCVAPPAPPNATPNPETPANDMNARVAHYNAYASAAQAYMNCLSNEAQQDSGTVSQSIVGQAQTLITDTQKNVTDLGAPLRLPPKAATLVSSPGAAPSTPTPASPAAPAPPIPPMPPPNSTSTLLMAPSAGDLPASPTPPAAK